MRLLLLPGGQVAEVEDLLRPPRPARRSPRACARGSSRSPSACRSGSGRERPRRRCPPPAVARRARTAIAGSAPGKFATRTGAVVAVPSASRLVHQGEQPVEPDRGPDARQPPVGEQAREVVVPPARGDAAELLPAVDGRLEDDPRVIVEPAGQAEVDLDADPAGRPPRRAGRGPSRRLAIPSAGARAIRAERRPRPRARTSTPPRPVSAKSSDPARPVPSESPARPPSSAVALLRARPSTFSRPILASLSSDRKDRPGPAGEAERCRAGRRGSCGCSA